MKRLFALILASSTTIGCLYASDIQFCSELDDTGNKIDASLFETAKSEEKDFLKDPMYIFRKTSSYSVAECMEIAKHNPEEGLKYFLSGYPKNVVAIQGDHSILYKRKCVFYFDFNYDNAIEVICDDDGIGTFNCIDFDDFSYCLERNQLKINNDSIAKIICKKFNDKLILRKCSIYPLSHLQDNSRKLHPKSKLYTLTLNIEKIDIGVSDGDFWENRRSHYKGATISGNIEIRPIDSDCVCCKLIVDRVNALWAPTAIERISNVIEDIITEKLFVVKEFYIYPQQ